MLFHVVESYYKDIKSEKQFDSIFRPGDENMCAQTQSTSSSIQ